MLSHDVIDHLNQNPEATNEEMAKLFGASVSTIAKYRRNWPINLDLAKGAKCSDRTKRLLVRYVARHRTWATPAQIGDELARGGLTITASEVENVILRTQKRKEHGEESIEKEEAIH